MFGPIVYISKGAARGTTLLLKAQTYTASFQTISDQKLDVLWDKDINITQHWKSARIKHFSITQKQKSYES